MDATYLITGTFVDRVVGVYKKEYMNFGFIPKPRLQRDFNKGYFFASDNGFVLVGSLRSEITPIHAVYIYPESRNGSTDKVKELLRMLPRKKYRVRCHFGKTFWQRSGLKLLRIENSNSRKRDVYVLEGYLNL